MSNTEQIHKNLLENSKLQIDHFVNSIPGGIAIYKMTDRFETLYFSEGVAKLSGLSQEEYAAYVKNNAADIVYEEDKERLLDAVRTAVNNNEAVDETYRIYHKNGGLVWVRLNGIVMGEEDGAIILHAVFQRPPRMAQLYDNLVNGSKSIIYVSDVSNYDLLYVNDTGLKTVGKEKADYSRKKCHEFLFGRSIPCEFCKIGQMNDKTFLEREITYPANNKIYLMCGKLTDWNGLNAHVEYAYDVTDVRRAQQHNEELTYQLQSAMDNIPGGMCVYRADKNGFQPVVHNHAFFEIFGYSPEHQEEVLHTTDFLNVHPEDVETLKKKVFSAIQTNEGIEHTYRCFHDLKGEYIWIKMNAVIVPQSSGEKLCYVSYTDVDKLKKIEQKLQENQLRYEVAVKSSGINVWEYDIQRDTLYVVSNSARIMQNCFYIEQYTKSTIDNGYVRPDSIERFLSIFERLKQGEKEVTEDIWYKTTDQAGWWCERVTYTTAFDADGNPVKAYGAGRDVTREKEAENKFHEEISYRKALQGDNLASVLVDLSENLVLEAVGGFNSIQSLNGRSADEYFAATAENIHSAEQQREFNKKFSRKRLLNQFGSGEFVVSMQFARLYDSPKVYWINYSAHLIQNPETKHIIAHVSCVDITDEKVMQTIMERVSNTDYDFFVVVDGFLNRAKDYAVANGRQLYNQDESFEAQNEAWIRSCVCDEDVERVVEECKIDNAWANSSGGEPYKFSFGMRTPNGEIRRKQIQFTTISEQRKTYLMSRIDVNDIYEEQEAAKKKLQKALTAKSEFLSNMSHDMRTPMNAIIGFSQMALEEKDPSAEMLLDAMGKINASGCYLLNLINNVLDMAKIENNKITLQPEPIDGEKLFGSIIASVKPMMEQKNIEFVFEIRNFIEGKAAVLDKLRTQQIFVNLLSNAAKFTPQGGRVECITECLEFDGRYSKERITIRDNGRGMSKEFIEKAFLPFEQEYVGAEAEQNGTGLGLAIVKNLVEMMGGTIQISSEKDVGTEIIINLITELTDKKLLQETEKEAAAENFDTVGKRILLCEDHPLNYEIAHRLLSKKGFLVELATDGAKGVELLSLSPEGYYAAVLMDIRMPVMDGIEATKAIRTLDRMDVKSLPIIAMTANAFDDDVKKSMEAGMNAHLAKPIEPQRLYDTLNTLLSEEEKRRGLT